MGCLLDEPLQPYICDASWNCKECPNWREKRMTNEEALKAIKEHCYFANLVPIAKEALDLAIKDIEKLIKIEMLLAMDNEQHNRTIKLSELKEVIKS